MSKRTQEYSLDPNVNEIPEDGNRIVVVDIANEDGEVSESLVTDFVAFHTNAALHRLIDSGIVTATDSAISWREGHLEHVARLYASDPARAWRDYADDITVALSADGSTFAALVERARGE